MNLAAQALGRRAKGVKKTITPARRAQLAAQLAAGRAKRWPAKPPGLFCNLTGKKLDRVARESMIQSP